MIHDIFSKAASVLRTRWDHLAEVEHANFSRVLKAFQEIGVGSHDLHGSSGYGYGDGAREKLEDIYAIIFGGEAALVRPQIASGTHALWLCLNALLKPGDHVLSVSGPIYDTLKAAIVGKGSQSLISQGITYDEIDLMPSGEIDLDAVQRSITPATRLLYVQRSKGYAWRPALSVETIERLCRWRDTNRPGLPILVDNCYSEFVQTREPGFVGVDLIAGSLIKNPGGTLAPGGGYVVGTRALVDEVAFRMTAPGLGAKVGPSYGLTPTLLQGIFMAPHAVHEALAGLLLVAWVLEQGGLEVTPRWDEDNADAVIAIRLGTAERLITFCQAVQEASPIDHYVQLEPGPLPGYEVNVVMAAGTFVQGASSELTADGPLRTPYAAYMQGGISRQHARIALRNIVHALRMDKAFRFS